jgi:hypothetical protein
LFPHTLDAKGQPVYTAFNPNAPDQICKYFREKGILLPDATKKSVAGVLEARLKKLGITCEVRNLDTYEGELDAVTQDLFNTWSYKQTGKGTQAWFDQKYFRDDGFLHPRFVTTGAQTTRLSSSKPNFTNVPARGWGALVRGGIVPRDRKEFRWAKSDLSQLELRSCLYQAGRDVSKITGDAFLWLVENSKGMLAKAAEIMADTERQAAKSVSHGADYLEGFVFLTPKELESARRQSEIRAGALVVFHPKYGNRLWEWRGKVACITGGNLAERLFGDKTFESRRKANEITMGYFKGFPEVSLWQQKSLATIEDSNYVKYPSGHQLEVVGEDVDVAKAAIAGLGQGVGSVYMVGVTVAKWEQTGAIPYLLVHDEYNAELPKSMSEAQVIDYFRFMSTPIEVLPGFKAPGKVYCTGGAPDDKGSWLPEENKKYPYSPELRAICLQEIGKV